MTALTASVEYFQKDVSHSPHITYMVTDHIEADSRLTILNQIVEINRIWLEEEREKKVRTTPVFCRILSLSGK